MTWMPVNLWTVIATFLLIATTTQAYSSHSSFADYESPNLSQFSTTSHKVGSRGYADPRWTALEEERSNYPLDKSAQGNLVGLNLWPDSETTAMLSRQFFGDKSADPTEPMRNREEISLDMDEDLPKNKREGHSLSIVNPLDVLRQRLMLEMARRRMKENQDQIRENAIILKSLGKRAASSTDDKGGSEGRTKQDYLRRIQITSAEDFDV